MPALLLVLLIVVPIVELYVIVQTAQGIGVLPTLGLLVLMSVVGSWLLKREGAKTWRAFRAATQAGRIPAKETADGALVILGGALLLTPGFVTDVFGLLCILPPTRAMVRKAVLGFFLGRVTVLGTPVREGVDRVQRVQKVQRVRSSREPAAGKRPANEPSYGAADEPPPALPPD